MEQRRCRVILGVHAAVCLSVRLSMHEGSVPSAGKGSLTAGTAGNRSCVEVHRQTVVPGMLSTLFDTLLPFSSFLGD